MPTCSIGFRVAAMKSRISSCPNVTCVPDAVCVYGTDTYQIGSDIPQPADSCQTCECSQEMDTRSDFYIVKCQPVVCNTDCSAGYEYKMKAGQCCGECVPIPLRCTMMVNYDTNGNTGYTGGSGSTGTSGGSGSTGTSGGSGSTGTSGGSGSTGTSGGSGSTGTSGGSGSTGTSGGSGSTGTSGGSGSTGTSGGSGGTGMTGGSGGTGSTDTSGGTGASGMTGGSGDTGSTDTSGGTGISGGSGDTGSTGGSGSTGTTGGSGSTGTSGDSGSTGTSGGTGISGGSGDTGSTGGSGSTGTSGGSESTGTSGGSGSTGTSGGSGSLGGSGGTGSSGATGSTIIDLEIGEIFHIPNNTCAYYECRAENGVAILTRVEKVCQPLDVSICDMSIITYDSDNCCRICTPKKEFIITPPPTIVEDCSVRKNVTVLEQNDCILEVELSYCGGPCMGSSMYSMASSGFDQKCSCCKEMEFVTRNVDLQCADGRRQAYSYNDVLSCGCSGAVCTPYV
eukprot:XP_017948624.1 PREDICTED: uncharacterized transmembrane protein DDB_G0289901-like [Xenopus tropicalis]